MFETGSFKYLVLVKKFFIFAVFSTIFLPSSCNGLWSDIHTELYFFHLRNSPVQNFKKRYLEIDIDRRATNGNEASEVIVLATDGLGIAVVEIL